MRRTLIAAILAVAAGLLPRGAWAFSDDSTRVDEIIIAHQSILEYGEITIVGAHESGALLEINVRQGSRVKAGQVLGRLRDQDIRANLEVVKANAENTNLIRQAEAKYNRAVIEKKMNKNIVERRAGLVSQLDVLQQAQDTEAAKWDLEQAKLAQRLLKLQQAQLEAELLLKAFICPHDGVVTDVYRKPGESVMSSTPIMRVVNTDYFKVLGSLDLKDSWRVKAGQKVRITPEIEGADLSVEREVFPGTISYVDNEVDPKTQTCRVVAEVKNRDDLLRCGLEVRMEILPKEGLSSLKLPGDAAARALVDNKGFQPPR